MGRGNKNAKLRQGRRYAPNGEEAEGEGTHHQGKDADGGARRSVKVRKMLMARENFRESFVSICGCMSGL